MTKRKKIDKQPSTKHYTENERSSNTYSTKIGGELGCSGRVGSTYSNSGTRRITLVTNNVALGWSFERLDCHGLKRVMDMFGE